MAGISPQKKKTCGQCKDFKMFVIMMISDQWIRLQVIANFPKTNQINRNMRSSLILLLFSDW